MNETLGELDLPRECLYLGPDLGWNRKRRRSRNPSRKCPAACLARRLCGKSEGATSENPTVTMSCDSDSDGGDSLL